MPAPIVAVDFDGVIHSYVSGWKGAHVIPDAPVPGAIDALLGYLEAGFNVAIFSSRSKSLRGRWAMKRYVARIIAEHWEYGGRSRIYDAEVECWGDAAGIYRKFSWPWFKPAALMTIDDRALTFNGDWSHPDYQPDAIRRFRPWNKRSDNSSSSGGTADAKLNAPRIQPIPTESTYL
jgi:hypothetical protein